MLISRHRAAACFLLGWLAAAGAVAAFWHQVQAWQNRHGSPVPLLVAAEDIPPLTALTPDRLATTPIEARDLPPGLHTDPAQVTGLVTAVPLRRGDLLTRAVLLPPDAMGEHRAFRLTESARGGVVIPPGLRPGERVDILAAVKEGDRETVAPVLQGALVLEASAGREPSLTLSLSLEEARRLMWAENYGRQVRVLRRSLGG
jgi:Flp pilus assembly protein CpaB